MKILPAVASVVNRASQTDWAQVLQLPQAYAVVHVRDSSGQALRTGVAILGALTRLLEQPPETPDELQRVLQEFEPEYILSLSVIVPHGDRVDVIQRGEGGVYLKRGNRLACLLNGPGMISGEVKPGDIVLLADTLAAELLSDAEIIRAVDHELQAPEIGERLTMVLSAKDESDGAAVLVFQIRELVPDPVPAPDVSPDVPEEPSETPPVAEIPSAAKRRHPFRRVGYLLAHLRPRLVRLIPGSNKKMAAAVGILGTLFIISVVLGIRKQQGDSRSQDVATAVTQAQTLFDEGVGLLTVNREQSRMKLEAARSVLAPYAEKPPVSKEGRRIPQLLQQINDNLEIAKQIIRQEPTLFYDLELIKKGAYIHKIALNGDTLAMLDQNQKSVFIVRIPTKNGEVLAGGQLLDGAAAIAAQGKRYYVLTAAGIVEISAEGKIPQEPIVPRDETWGTIGAMVAYGGNLYLSDTQKSRIWKYVATEVGFDIRREYLNPDTLPNLSKTTSMAIDGFVWLGTSDGKLLHFAQGKEDPFTMLGIEPPLGDTIIIYTTDELTNLYLLDAPAKRVVVLQKDGRYTAQYVWSGDITPETLLVSEEYKKIFLVAQGKLFAIDLR